MFWGKLRVVKLDFDGERAEDGDCLPAEGKINCIFFSTIEMQGMDVNRLKKRFLFFRRGFIPLNMENGNLTLFVLIAQGVREKSEAWV